MTGAVHFRDGKTTQRPVILKSLPLGVRLQTLRVRARPPTGVCKCASFGGQDKIITRAIATADVNPATVRAKGTASRLLSVSPRWTSKVVTSTAISPAAIQQKSVIIPKNNAQ
jgi:hypothetical protein